MAAGKSFHSNCGFDGTFGRNAFLLGLLLVINSCEAAIFCPIYGGHGGPYLIPANGPFGGGPCALGYDPSSNRVVPLQAVPYQQGQPAVQNNGYPGQTGQLGGVPMASQAPQQNVPLNLLVTPSGQLMMQVAQDPQQNSIAAPMIGPVPQQSTQAQGPQMLQYPQNVGPMINHVPQHSAPYNPVQTGQPSILQPHAPNPTSTTHQIRPSRASLSNCPVYFDYVDPPKPNPPYIYYDGSEQRNPSHNCMYYDEVNPNAVNLPLPRDQSKGIIIYDDGTTDSPDSKLLFRDYQEASSRSSDDTIVSSTSRQDNSTPPKSSTTSDTSSTLSNVFKRRKSEKK